MSRNYQQFFAICKANRLDKAEVVYEFTEGQTDSLSKLTDGEYHELLTRLRKLQPQQAGAFSPKPGDGQRKKLIAIAGKMNWGTTTIEIVGRLNAFLQERYSKELNEFDVPELNKIVWVFENKIYKDYLKRI